MTKYCPTYMKLILAQSKMHWDITQAAQTRAYQPDYVTLNNVIPGPSGGEAQLHHFVLKGQSQGHSDLEGLDLKKERR